MLGFLGFFSPFLFPSEQAEKPFQVAAGIICSLVIVSMRIGLRAYGSTIKKSLLLFNIPFNLYLGEGRSSRRAFSKQLLL